MSKSAGERMLGRTVLVGITSLDWLRSPRTLACGVAGDGEERLTYLRIVDAVFC